MKNVILYTDGACSFNPGPGGWGVVLIYKSKKKELSGGEKTTTNNRMELTAVIKGLEALKEKCNVDIFSDSAYVVNAFLKDWTSNWIKNNWKTSNKKEVLNQDLWEKLINLTNYHNITWNKVKGHSDNEFNNRCDELARNEVQKIINQS
ncbi:MAG: ribonuclease HI [Clostridia bacterium]|nr:ribonuclease HI [Clostridia bacterium]MDD4686280.1 ribonuclease HI [Clostridia bacterium]